MNEELRYKITQQLIDYRQEKRVSAAHIVGMALEIGFDAGAQHVMDLIEKDRKKAEQAAAAAKPASRIARQFRSAWKRLNAELAALKLIVPASRN